MDRSKLRRERKKYREEIRNKEQELFEFVDSIFVDRRKDATMTMFEVNGNYHHQTVIEEHYVIVGEPNGFYLSHVMPEDGSGHKIATSVYSAIKDTDLEQILKIVGSDGTTVMTGKSKGFIASSETLIGRPLQWVICLLHLDNVGRDEEVDVRKFIIPKINTNAKTYYSLSSLSLKDMHEPPALKHLLNKAIETFQQHKLNMEHPCQNQAVERYIKLVSEASAVVAEFKNRYGLIRQKIRSRKLMKIFNTKSKLMLKKLEN